MNETAQFPITVAAVIERDGRFLLVEEVTSEGIRYTQPSGHLDPDESLLAAVRREVIEEAAYEFEPTDLLGIYMAKYLSPRLRRDVTYIRIAFTGRLGMRLNRPLDHGIVRTVWMTRDEIDACRDKHRGPLVIQCVDDYLAGKRAPLDILYTHQSATHIGI